MEGEQKEPSMQGQSIYLYLLGNHKLMIIFFPKKK